MSDFRRVDLLGEGDRKLQKYFAGLDEDGVRTVILDYGGSCRRNLTIERIESTSQFSVVDRATEMIITVRNNGTETVRDVPVELTVRFRDGEKVETASLPPVTIEAIAFLSS